MRILGYGNCRAVATVEKRTACFPTVPTALGKLGKTAPSFPQFPQPLRLPITRAKKNSLSLKLKNKQEWTLRSQRRKKSSRPSGIPLAGFEVTTYGRF
jgi:hypothetical protein